MTIRELNVKIDKRPKLKELEVGDLLHVDTDREDDVFLVFKGDTDTFYMQSGGKGDVVQYSMSMIEKMLRSFEELHKSSYRITLLDMNGE